MCYSYGLGLLYVFTLYLFFVIIKCEPEQVDQLRDRVSIAPGPGRICGRFNVSDNSSFDIYDRENQNKQFAHILQTDDTHEKFYSVAIVSGCELIFCAIDLFAGKTRFCERFTTFADLNPEKYSFSVTASCSCKNPVPGCSQRKCDNVILDEDVCAQFYKEPNCSDCRYEPFKLHANTTINPTNNSFSVDSVVIRENCSLEIKSHGKPTAYYHGVYDSVQLSYVQKYEPAKFRCLCGILQKEIAVTPDSTNIEIESLPSASPNPFSNPVYISLGVLALILLLTGTIAIGFKYYQAKTKLLKYTNDAVQKFTDGSSSSNSEFTLHSNGQDNVAFEDGTSSTTSPSSVNCHYVSLGYLEALKQPYYSQYEVSRDNLKVDENVKLGKGNFGKVCQGILTQYGLQVDVAVKIAKKSTNVIYFTSLLDEIKILSFLGSHPNIVCIVGACTENIRQRDALLILELCSKGNLKSYLRSNRANLETESSRDTSVAVATPYQSWSAMEKTKIISQDTLSQLLRWSSEIANGMEFLCNKKVVHIDLAARNVLLTKNLSAKVGDFGLSRRIQGVGHYAKLGDNYGLPISWMALESLIEKRFTTESDIWSFGVVLWEIFSLGSEPYKEMRLTFSDLQQFLGENKRLGKPLHSSDEIYSEMRQCWNSQPSERPSFSQLREFFQMQLQS